MVGVWGVSPDDVSPGQPVFFFYVLDGSKRPPDDFLCCPHHPLQGLPVRGTAGAWPDRDAAGQYSLYSASVEGGENWRG